MHKVALDLLDESRAYLQFRLGFGHEWNNLRSLVLAETTLRETEGERLEVERQLAREWRKERLPRLGGLIDDFRSALERHRHKIGGLVDLSQHSLGELANGASSACQILLTFAERVANSRQQTFNGLEPDHLRALVEREIGFLARSTSGAGQSTAAIAISADPGFPQQPGLDAERTISSWREAAKKWRDLVPPIIRAFDGTGRIEHPPFVPGPLPSIHFASLELADASDDVARLAKREHVSASAALRLAAALRAVPGLPTLDQVDMVVEVERVLLAEIALDVSPRTRPSEQIPMTTSGDLATDVAGSTDVSKRTAATNTPTIEPGIVPPNTPSPQFSAVEKAIALLLRDGRERRSMRNYARLVGIHHSQLSRSDKWQAAWRASEPSPAELPFGTKDSKGNLEAWTVEACENCRQEQITSTFTANGEVMRVCEKCLSQLPRTNLRTT